MKAQLTNDQLYLIKWAFNELVNSDVSISQKDMQRILDVEITINNILTEGDK